MSHSLAHILWFLGLSGAGKSTLSGKVIESLLSLGFRVKLLDGDEIRKELTHQLGFSREDILKNNQFVLELCLKYQKDFDFIVVSVITPFQAARDRSREILGARYHEIFVSASLDSVMQRDVKGLYKKAVVGEIENFIGVSPSVPFERPNHPDLIVETDRESVHESQAKVMKYIQSKVLSQG